MLIGMYYTSKKLCQNSCDNSSGNGDICCIYGLVDYKENGAKIPTNCIQFISIKLFAEVFKTW